MPPAELTDTLRNNVTRIREAIEAACDRSGRDPREVVLVAVTKYVGLPVLRGLLEIGVTEIGENRVQQLAERAAAAGSRFGAWRGPTAAPSDTADRPRWHMIGHVQRNKVRTLLPHARIVHSVDSSRLAAELGKIAGQLAVHVDVLIEVNVAGEATKHGVAPAELDALVGAVREQDALRLRGLMTMAPFDPDPEQARPHFARLREMLADLRQRGAVSAECTELSMGMSQDYAVAVEEGATVVRLGSTLYEGLSPEYAPHYA